MLIVFYVVMKYLKNRSKKDIIKKNGESGKRYDKTAKI